jgi:hypothetical protein
MSTASIPSQTFGLKKPFSIHNILAMLFAVELREALDAATSGDKSDAAYTWGM